jgi:hypothetical protein
MSPAYSTGVGAWSCELLLGFESSISILTPGLPAAVGVPLNKLRSIPEGEVLDGLCHGPEGDGGSIL